MKYSEILEPFVCLLALNSPTQKPGSLNPTFWFFCKPDYESALAAVDAFSESLCEPLLALQPARALE
jgi:hypothetical protein